MEIGKMSSNAEYQMNELLQNLQTLTTNFSGSNFF